MAMTLSMVTFDTTDADSLATWWAEQTGGEVVERNDGWYVMVAGGTLPLLLAFQKVEDPTPGKNRIHLDLTAADLDGEVDRLLGAGATLVARRGDESFRWVTLADPQGNQFCVAAADHV
ncbi:VOC family protein [Georgenia sp. Marseille-Q6866]